MRLQRLALKNALYGRLGSTTQTRMSLGLSVLAHMLGQLTMAPNLGGITVVFGFGASQAYHPSLGLLGDDGFFRTMKLIAQRRLCSQGKGTIDPLVDRHATDPQSAGNGCDLLALSIT